jgi:hypothetical protein
LLPQRPSGGGPRPLPKQNRKDGDQKRRDEEQRDSVREGQCRKAEEKGHVGKEHHTGPRHLRTEASSFKRSKPTLKRHHKKQHNRHPDK